MAWGEKPAEDDSLVMFRFDEGVFRSIAIITFAYAPHITLVHIYDEMRNPTESRVRQWLTASYGSCWLLYACVGSFGYYTFYGDTHGNVLLNHEVDDIAVTIGRLCVVISVLAGFPCLAGPAVVALDRLFFPRSPPSDWGRRVVWVVVFVLACFGLAVLVSRVEVVLGVTGAGGLTVTAVVLPCALYIKQYKEAVGWCGNLKTKLCWATLVGGAVFGLVALAVNINDAVQPAPSKACTWPLDCPPQRCCTRSGGYDPPG
eukprot:gene21340-32817_t